MATYFISDTHFGHANIIDFCNRPFKSVQEMDRYLIDAWNARVRPEDTVYIVGDFAYRSNDPKQYTEACNGHKILIRGNHDLKALKNQEYANGFDEIHDILEISLDKKRIVMCHYPMAEWPGYFRASWLVHGHIHNRIDSTAFEFLKNQPRALNAGADIVGFAPVAFEELLEVNRKFKETH